MPRSRSAGRGAEGERGQDKQRGEGREGGEKGGNRKGEEWGQMGQGGFGMAGASQGRTLATPGPRAFPTPHRVLPTQSLLLYKPWPM